MASKRDHGDGGIDQRGPDRRRRRRRIGAIAIRRRSTVRNVPPKPSCAAY